MAKNTTKSSDRDVRAAKAQNTTPLAQERARLERVRKQLQGTDLTPAQTDRLRTDRIAIKAKVEAYEAAAARARAENALHDAKVEHAEDLAYFHGARLLRDAADIETGAAIRNVVDPTPDPFGPGSPEFAFDLRWGKSHIQSTPTRILVVRLPFAQV